MNDLGTSAGSPAQPRPPEAPQPPPPPNAPPPYRAMGLTLDAGPVRTRALVVIGIPLLIVLVLGVWAGSGSGGSGSGTSQGAPVSAPFGGTSGTSDTSQGQPATAEPSATEPTDLFGGMPTLPFDTGMPTGTDAAGTDPGLGGPASTDPGVPEDSGAPSASATVGPAEVVTAYYDAINNGDYQHAWDLGGKNIDASYADFVKGFAHTRTDTVTVGSVTGGQVSVTVDSVQTDGTRHSFSGTYQVAGAVITGGRLIQVS